MTVTSTRSGGIDLVRTADASVVQMWGEIDAALRSEASAALAGALESNLPVIVDATRIGFIDSAGVAFLVQLCTVGQDEGLSVTVRNPPPAVAEVFHQIGADSAIAEERG
ncbi:STAS domain-containing protein [Xylanimonas allomyrinae]|uniref:STAS domain-containing protein n=1 Tax=Xylanimonas allomyrinae TaxID=2509459 RepID=A0A4P6ERE7_9MICO|nr:STAS domain-containing protein [Xylanimonas allomyrinae]QAY62947.1 STAS domain-containing protein [Xylanimonas allomyrinae]